MGVSLPDMLLFVEVLMDILYPWELRQQCANKLTDVDMHIERNNCERDSLGLFICLLFVLWL